MSNIHKNRHLGMLLIMLSEINQGQRPNITCSCSFIEPRPKIIITIIIVGHENIWGTFGGSSMGEKRGRKGY
jgi:hypothetical protein